MPYTKAQTTTGAREALHKAYLPWLQVNTDLDRSLVSFQANKNEPFYRWFKYKEGFSSALVCYCLEKLAGKRGVLLDPFAGAGAALFACALTSSHTTAYALVLCLNEVKYNETE